MRKFCLPAIALVFLTVFGTVATNAQTIDIRVEGALDRVDSALSGVFSVGDTLVADISYDLSTPDLDPDPMIGVYEYAITSLEIRVGDYVATAPSGIVEVLDDYFWSSHSPTIDGVGWFTNQSYGLSGPPIGQLAPFMFGVAVETENLLTLSSDELPAESMDSQDFEFNSIIRFRFLGNGVSGIITVEDFFTVTVLTPVIRTQELIEHVFQLNLANGIENSLDGKLDAVLMAVDDLNQHNDVAAINALGAFISAVQAQRGKQISMEDADELIAAAQEIMSELESL